ncbi:MAG: hypothetical protein A2Z50_01280 [Nitrospirae bacterium RBG_19FT_COMBO_42_15]|nr:MAG: hypothetical protein A2Z50_01280 [Nitrospirae bacterium RBG_19FT_COMBO_42_15]
MAKKKVSGWSDLYTKEDWIAVWLGFLIIALILLSTSQFKFDTKSISPSFKWTTDGQIASRIDGWNKAADSIIKEAQAKDDAGTVKRLGDLKEALAKGDRKGIGAAAEKVARLGDLPGALGKEIAGRATSIPGKVFSGENTGKAVKLGIAYLILAAIGMILLKGQVGKFIIGFPIIFFLAWVSNFIAGNALALDWGVEYVVYALVLGILISNTVGVPEWLKPAVQTEYYIKTGLVILGSAILFFEILQGGALGIVQGILVVSVVWYACFWIARKLKVDEDFAAMLSTAVSICGVSAAIAACGAVEGDKKKLSYVTSLVLIVAVPMMVIMPWLVKSLGIPDLVGGAWIGGTLDTSGSVVAAGALISEAAMKAGVIVKFSQNVLIGVAAFVLSIVWTIKKGATTGEKPSARIIWERFPKFVLGFIIASILFSFILHIDTVSSTKSVLSGLTKWWFALAFVCIGLETKFTELASMEGGRPAAAFIIAQALNVVWTLILAYLLFGGILFAVPNIR